MLVEGVRAIEAAQAHPVDKDKTAAELAPVQRLFTKSVVAKRDITPGEELNLDVLAFKKPGTGFPANRWKELVGRKARRLIAAGNQISVEDIQT